MNFLAKEKMLYLLDKLLNILNSNVQHFKSNKKSKRFELPVAEEMQMGMTIGLGMNGIYRFLFIEDGILLLASNQLINHLDKISLMSKKSNKIIIRTIIGSKRPLNPQHQHVETYFTIFQDV